MIFYYSCSEDSGNELETIKHLRKARTLGRWRYERDKRPPRKTHLRTGIRHPWPHDDGVPGKSGRN